jgi:hypothetical protein
MDGAIPPLPQWRGAQLKKAQGQLYIYLLMVILYLDLRVTK